MRGLARRLGLPGPRHPVCLYLHSISDAPFARGAGPTGFLSPGAFRSALKTLVARMQPRRLADVVGDDSRRWLGRRSLVLTFDDGFRDTLTTALPILEEFDVPATVFVTTGFVDREVLPYEIMLAKVLPDRNQLEVEVPGGPNRFPTATADEKKAAYRELTARLKPASHADRERFLESLAPENEVVEEVRDLYLDWDDLARLRSHPLITLGAHSRFHLALAHQPAEAVLAEMNDSHDRLTGQLGIQVDSFAFPYGSHNDATLDLVRDAGFRIAVTTSRDVVRPGGNPFAVPRCELRRASSARNYARAILRP